jgi:DNA-binding transcriptional ArsR family regulator
MKYVYIVDRVDIANVLVDPMRRAILDLLRIKPMTQAQLAKELGLSGASLNYHMQILRSKKLVVFVKRELERHKIVQKFYSSSAYLFVYDLDSLPKHIARYFYPVSLERARGVISTLKLTRSSQFKNSDPVMIDDASRRLSEAVLQVARKFDGKEATSVSEEFVYDLYLEAVKRSLYNTVTASRRG